MDLNWLRDFECLARTQNFTRAADERSITQSAFSRRIKALESWVGLPLVNRATYPVELTESGHSFLPVAVAAVSRLSEARQSLRDADQGENRFVRLSVLPTISIHVLAQRLDAMQRDLPDLRTRVISESLNTCCELLVESAVDIMLCYSHPSVSLEIDEARFARKDLMVERLIPVALRSQVVEHGWDLDQPGSGRLPYLAYERSSFLGMVVEATAGGKPLVAKTLYVDGLVEAIKRRLMAGCGFAWMPESAIARELETGQVVPIGGSAWVAKLTVAAFASQVPFDQPAQDVWRLL